MVLEKTLESPLGCKEIKPVNHKGDQPWIFIRRTDTEAETPILWPPNVKNWLTGKVPDAGKDWRQEEKGTTENETDGWHHWLDGHEFKQALGAGERQASLACCNPWGHKELEVTERLNWSTVCLSIHLLTDIWATPRSRIVESYHNSTFNILRNHHTVFHGGYTILHLYVQCTRVSVSPYPHKTCYFVLFFQIAILIGMKWYFMGFDLLFPNDYWSWEYFYVLVGHLYSFFFFLEKCLYKYFVHF